MMSLSQAKPLAGALALLVGFGVSAPAMAGEAAAPKPTLVQAATARAAALDLSAARATVPAPGPSATQDKPFLKTTKGVVSLILVAGATAWVVQSRIDNKVSSPARH
jgi:hypothetical protein